MLRRVLCTCLVCVYVIAGGSASAVLLDLGNMTRDTATDLEWLDLTLTSDRTFLDVSTEFGSGGDFEGFRYASLSEVSHLFVNAGIPNVNTRTFTAANYEPVIALMALIGTERPDPNFPQTSGVTSDAFMDRDTK